MYDIIIIGAGTAGIAAYKQAIRSTQNLLIINAGPWDTTCARVGCMPSKVLISTANRMHDIQHANEIGLNINGQVDTTQVMHRVRSLRDQFTQATLDDVEKWPAEHKISGIAKFINANTIEVNGQHYQAKSFIIAVGSTPNYDTAWKEELGDLLITSDQIFELPQLPQSLAVIGSGVIAIELAQAMQRLGVNVTMFARSRKVGSLTSPQLQTLAQETLSQELNILFETLPNAVRQVNGQVEITYTEHATEKTLTTDYVLVATGRKTNLSQLKLEQIEPKFNDLKNLPIDQNTKQLTDYPIFVVGDAHTSTPIQHEAAHEGKMAVHNCLHFPKLKSIKTLVPLGIVFSEPEMASVGQNYQRLSRQKVDFVTGFVSYERQGRARVLAKNQGAIEIYIDKHSQKILGAELFCPSAEHLAHLLAWLIDTDANLTDALDKPFYHPTLEEGLRTALKHARRQLS